MDVFEVVFVVGLSKVKKIIAVVIAKDEREKRSKVVHKSGCI